MDSQPELEYDDLLMAYRREKNARQQSEQVLQSQTRRLYQANEELTRANSELKKHQRMVIEQEKMAALGTLIAGMAHEVNNPLGYAMGNIQILKLYWDIIQSVMSPLKDLDVTITKSQIDQLIQQRFPKKDISFLLEDMDNLIEDTETGLNRVKDIVISLKDFSRKDESIRVLYNINKAIESAVNILSNELNKIDQISLDLLPLPEIYCNPNVLIQVSMNLIANAIDAMKDASTKKLTIRTLATESHISIHFEDTGCGMTPEIMKDIFVPFFTTKSFGKGTGLGLSICYEKVKDLRGQILVESQLGKGSRFTILLPRESRESKRIDEKRTL